MRNVYVVSYEVYLMNRQGKIDIENEKLLRRKTSIIEANSTPDIYWSVKTEALKDLQANPQDIYIYITNCIEGK